MPYCMQEIDDFDCDEIICSNNEDGYCTADESTENLSPDQRKYCLYFRIGQNKEKDVYSQSDIDDFMDAVGEDVNYVELDPESDRLVLKVMNVKVDDHMKEKLTVFRVNREDECVYRFFSHINGGVGAVHKSVDEANFLKDEVI